MAFSGLHSDQMAVRRRNDNSNVNRFGQSRAERLQETSLKSARQYTTQEGCKQSIIDLEYKQIGKTKSSVQQGVDT